jgi:hypothetical protein
MYQLFLYWEHFVDPILCLSNVPVQFCLRFVEAFRGPSNRNCPIFAVARVLSMSSFLEQL